MKKKVLSTLLAAAVIASAMPVMQAGAFGGTYPKSVGYGGMVEQESTTAISGISSNAANLFTVGGKTFILLDTDKEGNYFVMTEDLYGNHWYDTSYTNQPIIETRDDKGNYTPGPAYDVDDAEWIFNTEDPTNIGYWLNNDFWENGNGDGTGYILPQEIKDNVIEKTWQVEGMKAVLGWTAGQNYDQKYGIDHAAKFAVSRVVEPYTVTGKLALMSYTEFKQYQSIISLKHNSDEWRGFMFRTPHAMINGNATSIKYAYGGGMAKNRNTSTKGNMVTCVNDSPASMFMFVRPVMFLSKDFFKNVKIDLNSAGEIPLNEIRKLPVADLINIYDLDDVNKLFSGTVTDVPKVEELEILGTPVAGSVLYADYDFIPAGAEENNSEICWIVADSVDGKYASTGVTGNKFYVGEELKGKIIKYYMRPKDADNKLGKIYLSDAASAVAESETVSVKDMDLSGNTLSITLTNPTESSITARLISAVYDENNQLVSVKTESVELGAGQETAAQIDMSGAENGKRVSAMVWSDNNQPILHIGR